MTTAIKTKYANGVFQPLETVDLPEGFDVTVYLENAIPTIDNESRAWVDANLSRKLPPYDWGKGEIPEGNPVEYDPELGFVVIEE